MLAFLRIVTEWVILRRTGQRLHHPAQKWCENALARLLRESVVPGGSNPGFPICLP